MIFAHVIYYRNKKKGLPILLVDLLTGFSATFLSKIRRKIRSRPPEGEFSVPIDPPRVSNFSPRVCFWWVFWGAQISHPEGGFRYVQTQLGLRIHPSGSHFLLWRILVRNGFFLMQSCLFMYLNPPRVWNLCPLATKNTPGGWNLIFLEGLGMCISKKYSPWKSIRSKKIRGWSSGFPILPRGKLSGPNGFAGILFQMRRKKWTEPFKKLTVVGGFGGFPYSK